MSMEIQVFRILYFRWIFGNKDVVQRVTSSETSVEIVVC